MDIFRYFAALILEIAGFWFWFVLACVLFFTAWWLLKRWGAVATKIRRFGYGVGIVFSSILAVILLLSSMYQFWYTHRPSPSSLTQVLFESVTYVRDVLHEPRPLVIHLIRVQLQTPGIHFLVTPGDSDQERPLTARTTSQFLSEFDLQIAVNGDFFVPWWSNGIFDYYPHIGDPVSVNGVAVSCGESYSEGGSNYRAIFISSDNHVQFVPLAQPDNTISGNYLFLEHGLPALFDEPYHTETHPRTAVGLDQRGDTLLMVVVDGRQPGYSEGVSMKELGEIMIEYGAYDALNLDGGGSTTLVAEGMDGQPVVLNSPIDQRIPGRERPVANHLGIYALMLN